MRQSTVSRGFALSPSGAVLGPVEGYISKTRGLTTTLVFEFTSDVNATFTHLSYSILGQVRRLKFNSSATTFVGDTLFLTVTVNFSELPGEKVGISEFTRFLSTLKEIK